jgi:undecaprenyl-diphosphatase
VLELDTLVFRFFNSTLAAPWLDGVMLFLSSRLVWALVAAAFVGWAIYQRHARGLAFAVLLGLTIGATDAMTYQVLKPAFGRFRPCYEGEDAKDVVVLEGGKARLVADSCGGDYGFPSNHAANAMAAAVAGALTWRRRRLNVLLFGIGALVGLSRVYLGVHFPGDVLGGFVVGALISLALWLPWRKALARFYPAGLPASATARP